MSHSSLYSKAVYWKLSDQLLGRKHSSNAVDSDGTTSSRPPWHPFLLTLWPSLTFGIVLLGGVIGLEVFVRLSDLQTGFAVPPATLQNLGTYVPVAFVIGLGWVWQAYAVEVKKIAPWVSISTGPVSATDLINLDYIGSNPIVAMVVAVRKRHYSILVCTIGSLAIAVCSIVAASIWDLDPTSRVLPVNLQRTGTYNSSYLGNTTEVAHFLSRYLSRTVLQLPSPSWMTDDFIIAPFNASEIQPEMLLSGTTQGYNASLTCEKAGVSLSNNGTNVTITYAGTSKTVPCDVFRDISGNWSYTADPYLYTGKVYNWTIGSRTPAILLATQLIPPNNCASATAVGCMPNYSVFDVDVSVHAETAAFDGVPRVAGALSTVSFAGGDYLLQTIDNNNGVTGSPWNTRARWFANNNDPFAYIPWTTSPRNITEVGNYSPWFHLLRHLLLLDPKQLMDASTLAQGSQKIFSDIWRNVIQPTDSSNQFQGTATITEKRLMGRVGSIRAIEVCLCILAAIAFFVSFWRPSTRLPRDPSSLASGALILAESDSLAHKLEGSGGAHLEALESRLCDAKYQLAVDTDGTTGIASISDEKKNIGNLEPQVEGTDRKFGWAPPILHPLAKLALAAVVLALVAVLELLVQLSSRRNGLADVNGDRAQRYAWSYAGPVILFVLCLGVELFDSAVRTVHPFVLLHRAPQPGSRLTYDPLHHSVITLPFHAIRHRQPTVLISTLAVLLLLVAKIAVAGLFTIDDVARVKNVQVDLNTTFAWNATTQANAMVTNITAPYLSLNLPFYESGGDDYELPPLQLIVRAGLQTPNWTTPDIAVGALATDSSFGSLPTSSNLTARLPVVYSDLVNCTSTPYTSIGPDKDSGAWYIMPQLNCLANYGLSSNFSYSVTRDQSGHAGAVFPMPGIDSVNNRPLNCSTIFFVFVRDDDVNLISCNYTMTQATMEADLAVDSATSYRVLSVDRTSEQDVTPFDRFSRLPLIFSGVPTPDSIVNLAYTRNDSAPDAFSNGAPYKLFRSGSYDYLFAAITANTSDIDSLLDPNTLIAAVRSQWSRYFAHIADAYMRVPVEQGISVSGALAAPQQRIFVNPKPARILEGLLAGVFVCVAAVSLTLNTKGVLPRPPYSIASRMSFLAGSELLNLPALREPGTQHLSDAALENRLSGIWFKLGWGNAGEKGLQYGIIVEASDRNMALEDYEAVEVHSPHVEAFEMQPRLPQQLGQGLPVNGEKLVSV